MQMSRKQFMTTLGTLWGSIGGLALVSACGDSAPYGEESGDGPEGNGNVGSGTASCSADATSSITANHGHALLVPADDVDAATEKTYDIAGASPHSHEITVTASDFAQLAAGNSVTVMSTEGASHVHSVTLTCA